MITRLRTAVYQHSPVWVQNLLCTWAGRRYQKIRYGGEFKRWAELYTKSRTWSHAELREYQRQQTRELLEHCCKSVPFYAEKWKRAGLGASDFKDLDDLAKFPCTTKEDLFRHADSLVAAGYERRRMFRGMTGGSTGMPLVRYFTDSELQRHYAIFWDRMRQGVRLGDRYAAFQGKEIVPAGQSRQPYWRENRATNQRLYSMRHLSPDKLQAYAHSLVDTPFIYYQGYVSILSVVAEFMAERRIVLPSPPKAVFTTSEELTPAARQVMEQAWQTKVSNEYCQGERCAMIQQCEHGNHHPVMEYGVIEYEPIAREGECLLAEIICTGFVPYASPVVRYRVGDRVLIDENAICPCGRPSPVIKAIRGRTGDYIVTPDGRKYPHISLIVDLLRNVRCTQVVQDRPEEILVRIVPYPAFDDGDRRHLIHCFQDRIGGGIGVKVEKVNELERSASGKIPSIINRIPSKKGKPGA